MISDQCNYGCAAITPNTYCGGMMTPKTDTLLPANTSREPRTWAEANREKRNADAIRYTRRHGVLPFNENRECAQYLGVHIAERVLSLVFKDVRRMPMNNSGYDVICNHDKLIDIKSSTMHEKRKNAKSWDFHIRHNTIADFFLCLAFDNREDLNPLHAWLIPGSKLNHLIGATISISTIDKWDEYKLDLSKIRDCCDAMR